MNSTIALALIGSVTKKQFGSNKIWVQNTLYRLSEYHPYNLTTKCQSCQQYDHPSALCKASKPICTICAGGHPTSGHPCRHSQCIQGQRYTHQPIKCAVCNNPHKSRDKNCPAGVAAVERMRRLRDQNIFGPDPTQTNTAQMQTQLYQGSIEAHHTQLQHDGGQLVNSDNEMDFSDDMLEGPQVPKIKNSITTDKQFIQTNLLNCEKNEPTTIFNIQSFASNPECKIFLLQEPWCEANKFPPLHPDFDTPSTPIQPKCITCVRRHCGYSATTTFPHESSFLATLITIPNLPPFTLIQHVFTGTP
jgi:hypothetical protein